MSLCCHRNHRCHQHNNDPCLSSSRRLPVRHVHRGIRGIDGAQSSIIPVIFVFILLLVDFGTALDRREVLQHAVREGARKGAVAAGVSEIVDTTVAQSQGLLHVVFAHEFDGDPGAGVCRSSARNRATRS